MDADYNMSRQLCYYFYFDTPHPSTPFGKLRVQLRVQIRDRALHDFRLFEYEL